MRLVGPAPTARAKAASATRMTAVLTVMLTVEANCHSLRPLLHLRQNLWTVERDGEGVLEVRGQAAVGGYDGPLVA